MGKRRIRKNDQILDEKGQQILQRKEKAKERKGIS